MPAKRTLNDRQRRFAEFVVGGDPAGRAYEKAGFSSKGNVADSAAERLLRNVEVAAYIEELRAAAVEASGMTREEVVNMLAEIIRSKPSDATMDNPLCELKMSKAGPFAGFPDKARSLERLCKMLGWDAAEKVDAKIIVEVVKKW